MKIELSEASKSRISEYIKTDGLNDQMVATLYEYLLTLRVSELSKETYLSKLKNFGIWLLNHCVDSFQDANNGDINRFLEKYNKNTTKNSHITALKPFYRDFLNKPEVIKNLKHYPEHIETITPSDVLTTDEVIKIAEHAGKRREMDKVIILTLFESCARITELLHLKRGDVQFSTVKDKEKNRHLTAVLHFKRSKGNIPKQPVVLLMFAAELKRYMDNQKGDSQSWLFPSPRDSNNPLTRDTVSYVLWYSGTKVGIKKRLNPHWLRHSGLSYFANSRNYNEQLLMWRAGWTNTSMAGRYIHSGAELERKAYLEKMGLAVEERIETKISEKTCPHCSKMNPYTINNCDFCGMPLDITEYQREIEKRRNVELLFQNMNRIYSGKLSEAQKAQLAKHSETIKQLIELGRDDLATYYMRLLLESWAKLFLTA